MEKLLERFGVRSEAELKKKIERAEPLNIGIFVTGGKEDKCWYCSKRLKPCNYDYVVTINGELRPVCHDDRTCRSGTGIMGRGTRPPKKRQAKNKTLQKARERHET